MRKSIPASLLEIMPALRVSQKHMDTPFTLDRQDRPVTLRELQALHAAGQSNTVMSVGVVSEDFMVECAIRSLRDVPANHVILSGRRSFTPRERIQEIESKTDIGVHEVRSYRNYCQFLEDALFMGKILEVPNPD